jgi:prepilin-type N-terminal cleavage/methylation domain-containing protein
VNEKKRAFTLIELLIVVAIIAILAAIAVPNFLEAQVRSKVSKAQADMRSLATAVEAYAVDRSSYPAALACFWGSNQEDSNGVGLGESRNINTNLHNLSEPGRARGTFATIKGLGALTTPTAYITSYPSDPFATTKGLIFGYCNMGDRAWILWSYGPDCDECSWSSAHPDCDADQIGTGMISGKVIQSVSGQTEQLGFSYPGTWGAASSPTGGGQSTWVAPWNTVFSPTFPTATTTLLTAGYTYDTTNGSKSRGDIWRVKQ